MKILRFSLAAAAASAVALLICLWSLPKAEAAGSSTQSFVPNRYALFAAEVNVSALQHGSSPNTRQILVKADTHTGQCWILELQIGGSGNFHILRANWRPTTNTVSERQ